MIGTAALPRAYRDLAAPDAPRLIREAVALYGTTEDPGARNDPQIMAWAAETAKHVKGYTADSIPWCGLFAAVVAQRAGFDVPTNPLWALNWLNFGVEPAAPMLGDVLVWRRKGGGHVGFYVGEDATHYHCLGGNQGDTVSIIRLPKKRAATGVGFRGARRPIWKVAQPATVRIVPRAARGAILNSAGLG
jgi:uncharacterized protein (TIGR02594 family)